MVDKNFIDEDVIRILLSKHKYHLPRSLHEKLIFCLKGIADLNSMKAERIFIEFILNVNSELYQDVFSFSAICTLDGTNGLHEWLQRSNSNKFY